MGFWIRLAFVLVVTSVTVLLGLHAVLDVRKASLLGDVKSDKELIKDHTEGTVDEPGDALLRGSRRKPRLPETKEALLARFYHVDVFDEATYPEYEAIKHKPNVGICLSGGGARSFEASLGYLRALLDADLLKYVRYISSVSGGSWANAVFTYHDEEVVKLNDLLGSYTPPERMTRQGMRGIPLNSARGYPVYSNMIGVVASELLLKGTPVEDVWVKAVHEVFLKKAGIGIYDLPAWSKTYVAEAVARNPDMMNDLTFRMPCSGSTATCHNIPFPIMNNAMLGPVEAAPFGLYQRRYVMMEATALYVGFPHIQNVTYPNNIHLALGGLVEPLGFGSVIRDKQFCGLLQCSTPQLKRIPRPFVPFGIANATAASSWAPGALVAEQPILRPLDNVLITAPYFSPFYGGQTREVFVGDGANMENQGLIALLQRNVKRIVMFINTPIPLTEREGYHPYLRPPQEDVDIDSSITALFGIFNIIPPFGEDFSHDQVFRKRDFPRVVSALQEAQKEGRGAVAGVDLVTVENRWWGVPAGRKVHIVFVYLGRVYEWESLLEPDVADWVAPQRLKHKPHLLPKEGVFKDFPHFSTTKLRLEPALANALADMSAWVVKRNIKLFKRAIKPSFWADRGSVDAGAPELFEMDEDDVDTITTKQSQIGKSGHDADTDDGRVTDLDEVDGVKHVTLLPKALSGDGEAFTDVAVD